MANQTYLELQKTESGFFSIMKPELHPFWSKGRIQRILAIIPLYLVLMALVTRASDLWIYTDSLQDGWISGGNIAGPVDLNNSSPVYSGSYSIAATISAGQNETGIILFQWPSFDATGYGQLDFEINGGATGVYWVTVGFAYSGFQTWYYTIGLGPVAANTWQNITVTLPSPSVQDPETFQGFDIFAGFNNGATLTYATTVYLDDIRLTAVPEPAIVSFLLVGVLSSIAFRRCIKA